ACWRCPPRHRELFLTLYARLSARILKLDRSQLLAVYPLDFVFYVANPVSSVGGPCLSRSSPTAARGNEGRPRTSSQGPRRREQGPACQDQADARRVPVIPLSADMDCGTAVGDELTGLSYWGRDCVS